MSHFDILDANKDKILRELVRMSVEDVARRYNVSRRHFFRWLKERGISVEELRRDAKRQLELKLQRAVKKADLARLPPRDFEEFKNLDCIKKFIAEKRAAGSKVSWKDYLSALYAVCKGTINPKGALGNGERIRIVEGDWLGECFRRG